MLAVAYFCRGKPHAMQTFPKPRTGAEVATPNDATRRATTVTGRGVSFLPKLSLAGEVTKASLLFSDRGESLPRAARGPHRAATGVVRDAPAEPAEPSTGPASLRLRRRQRAARTHRHGVARQSPPTPANTDERPGWPRPSRASVRPCPGACAARASLI